MRKKIGNCLYQINIFIDNYKNLTMKKLELQQIIKEEINKILNEQKSNIELIGPDIDELLDAINLLTLVLELIKVYNPIRLEKIPLKHRIMMGIKK
jgi:hypothetical protein